MIVSPEAVTQQVESAPLSPAPDLPYLKRFRGRTSSPPEEEASAQAAPLALERPPLRPLRVLLALLAIAALLAYAAGLWWSSRDKIEAWFGPGAKIESGSQEAKK
jgi:hypothetical protein